MLLTLKIGLEISLYILTISILRLSTWHIVMLLLEQKRMPTQENLKFRQLTYLQRNYRLMDRDLVIQENQTLLFPMV